MDNQPILDSIWQSLENTPRMKVNQLLATMGLGKNMYAKLPDADAKKLVLGMATRLDANAQSEILEMVR